MIEFSPPAQPGPPTPPPPVKEISYRGHSSFWPLLLILATLIFTTVRDGVALQRRTTQMREENAQPLETLTRSGQQVAFVDAVHKDLTSAALTDPAAAQILKDLFPAGPPATSDTTPAPAK